MATQANHLLKTFRRDWLFSFCLSLTFIFFLYKGVLYALIGSFVPLLFILTILGLLVVSFNRSPKAFKRSVGLWSVLIVLWSAVRLLLSTVNQLIKPIPEGHIDGQLGPMSVVLSVVFLCAGIYIWKNRKRLIPR